MGLCGVYKPGSLSLSLIEYSSMENSVNMGLLGGRSGGVGNSEVINVTG